MGKRDSQDLGEQSTAVAADETPAGDLGSLETLSPTASPALAGGCSPAVRSGPFAGGAFEIERELGAGGMGVVYLARDTRLDRRVAIKLPRVRADDEGFERLMREATAMAQLSHPNVVRVYEVGADGSQPFIVMEYMSGGTLRGWLRETERSVSEVLDQFAAVGAGLMAAHDAGITHRDFKPDNVFIASDGRACVADFGLARAVRAARRPEEPAKTRSRAAGFDSKLTTTGATLGTPAYMAPEQFDGGAVDARVDQFAFCVALYEALYDQHPFGGSNFAELRERIKAGRVLVPDHPPRRVARWLRKLLLRGLAVDPDQRYRDMHELLGDLSRQRRRRRLCRAGGVVAAALVAIVGGTWVAAGALSRTDPCAGLGRRLDGVWDSAVAARVADALKYDRADWPRTKSRLDAYRRRWIAARIKVCRASHRRGKRDERAHELSVSCLAVRRDRLKGLVSVLESSRRPVVGGVADAVAAMLPDPGRCLHVHWQGSLVALPPPAVAATVNRVRLQLDRAQALDATHQIDQALALAEDLVARARATGYRPVLARSLLTLGRIRRSQQGQARAAVAAFKKAMNLAVASGDHALVAKAAINLTELAGAGDRASDAEQWFQLGLAAIERRGGDLGLEGALRCAHAKALDSAGKTAKAVAEAERCVKLNRKGHGAGSAQESNALDILGGALVGAGDYHRAVDTLRRALAIRESISGEQSADTARVLANLGAAELRLGRLADAKKQFERALAIRQAIFGGTDLPSAELESELGVVLTQQGKPRLGLAHAQKSLAIERKILPDDSATLARSLGNLAIDYESNGKRARAVALARQSLQVFRRAYPKEDHPDVVNAYVLLGSFLRKQGHADQALPLNLRGVKLAESIYPPGHPQTVNPLIELGHTQTQAGDLNAAVATLSRALELSKSGNVPQAWVAEANFALATALRKQHRQPARARRAAEKARAIYGTLGAGYKAQVSKIDRWLGRRAGGTTRAPARP